VIYVKLLNKTNKYNLRLIWTTY